MDVAKDLSLKSIRIDETIQPRERLAPDTIARYRDEMKAGAKFPPVDVFFDAKAHWLADGFHRYEAAQALKRKTIAATVHKGTKRDAALFAAMANHEHGLPLSNRDKQRIVMRLLSDPNWSQWSDGEIARKCHVSQRFVSGLRPASQNGSETRVRLVRRGGKVFPLNTTRIGRQPAPLGTDEQLRKLLAILCATKGELLKYEEAYRTSKKYHPELNPGVWNRAFYAMGSAHLVEATCNRKLAPVVSTPGLARPHVSPAPPYVAATTVSVEGTCPSYCPFKGNGCYVEAGPDGFKMPALDRAAQGVDPFDVIAEEVRLIDGAFGGGEVPQDGRKGHGRDLRLHVGGEVPVRRGDSGASFSGAGMLAGAAARWRQRGGGSVWTYTHAWRRILRKDWGTVSVLASVEQARDISKARRLGYPAAIVVDNFPNGSKSFRLKRSTASIIPCPAETKAKRTCVQCRLCLDRDLLKMNVAIGFEVHGRSADKARNTLQRLGRHPPEGRK